MTKQREVDLRVGKLSVAALVVLSNLVVLSAVGAVLFVIWPRDRGAVPPATPVSGNDPARPAVATQPAVPAEDQPRAVESPVVTAKPVPDEAVSAPKSVADIANLVEKSVVLIETYDTKGDQLGFGTGFIVDDAGNIATNYHVLSGCSLAKITYHDKRTAETTGLRAWDDHSDLAILDAGSAAARPAPLKLAAGFPERADEVIAIGHPRGLQFTTTNGIVSAVYRTDELPAQFRQYLSAPKDQRWIQTTAVVIGGSSGGPLLDSDGEVVGVNTWSVNDAKLGFAVQIDSLRTLMSRLRETPATLAAITGPQLETERLIAEYNTRWQWFTQEASKLRTKAAYDKLVADKHPAPNYVRRLKDLADKHPDSPSVFWIWQTVCQIALQAGAPDSCRPELEAASQQLVKQFADDTRLRGLAWEMRASTNEVAWTMLRTLSDKSADDDIKGLALLSLAAALQTANTDGKHTDDAMAQLERILAEYRDVPFGGKTLGAYAEDQLYLLKNLSVGRKPPEIVGTDVEGTEFKLSDFAGKVTVLDFWADWCPHCVAMYPLERRLVKQLADEPFALLGINTDEPDRLKGLIDKQTVTWKNWSDGQQGPIAELYRVESFPTLFVLDHEGVIRYRDVRGEQLSKAVKELLEKVPGRKSSTSPPDDRPADALQPEGSSET